MKIVAQALNLKPTGIVAISPDVTVLDATKRLAEKNVGALLVNGWLSRGGTLFGEGQFKKGRLET